jgi:predicted phosphohydrolase
VVVEVSVDKAVPIEFRDVHVVHRQEDRMRCVVAFYLSNRDRKVLVDVRFEKRQEQSTPVGMSECIELHVERCRRWVFVHTHPVVRPVV